MRLHELEKMPSRKTRKRVGRGQGSGWGKTCGRGSNGQKSRSGDSIVPNFTGGNIPFTRRMPKMGGFRNINRKAFAPVNLGALNDFPDGGEVTPEALKEKGLLRSGENRVKILARGELEKKLTVKAHAISRSALEALAKAGGEFVKI